MSGEAPDVAAWLDELERLRAAATPGEWRRPLPFTKLIDGPQTQLASAESAADAALIVAAVNALPTLIAELRKRDAALRAVEALAASWDGEAAYAHNAYDVGRGEAYEAAAIAIRSTLAAALSPEGETTP